jgi:hypothetical protein
VDAASQDSNRYLVADGDVMTLSQCLADGVHGLAHVPIWLKKVLERESWKKRVRPGTGEIIEFKHFEEFVSTRVYWGLGSSVAQLKNLMRDEPEVIDLMDRAMQRPSGRPTETLDNVQDRFPSGNSSAAALRRLRKDRPDLHAKVLAGEMSPHAAAIAAGFRKPTVTLPADPQLLAEAIIKRHPRAAQIIADKLGNRALWDEAATEPA